METRLKLAALLGSLYDLNPEGIAVFDRDGLLVSCNPAALAMTGFEAESQVAGAHFGSAIFEPDSARVQEAFNRALSGQSDCCETFLLMRTGGMCPVEISMFPAIVDGQICGVFVQVSDNLGLHQAEQSLTISQQRFRSLFEYHPDAVIALKPDGSISRVNVALESSTGFYGEQIINRPWLDLIAPESREIAEESFRECSRGEAVEFDCFLLDRLDNRIDVQMKLVPLRVAQDVEGAYAIAKDVTAQRSAEKAIVEQGERIRELYLAASARGDSVESQIDNTLTLGCRLFGFDYGYVTHFEGASLSILNAVGEGAGLPSGAVYALDKSLSRHLSSANPTLFIPDLDDEHWKSDPARENAPWRSFFAIRLSVNNLEFGSLVFSSRTPHPGLTELDRDLIQLVALFVASALERARYAERIEQLAFYDALTGLPNRVLFDDRIRQTMGAAKRYNRGFAVMYLDLDEFKAINDRFGHPTGDRVLRAVADRLTQVLRESDTLARFGGDEFVVLQPVVNGAADAADLAQKLVLALREPLTIEDTAHTIRTSIGVALYPGDGTNADELMEAADRGLYGAKRAGRNTWQFSSRRL